MLSGIRPCAEFYAYAIRKEREKEKQKIVMEVQSEISCVGSAPEDELANADVKKAIQTMKKDRVIHPYQFLVGEELLLGV